MPKSLVKTRKKIAKKKSNIDALHQNSRDSQRLRRAEMRDARLERVATARRKLEHPYLSRTAFFQSALRQEKALPLQLNAIKLLIEQFVHKHDEEFNRLKRERRAGRPASTREDLLRMKIAGDEKEYENGFLLPDLTDTENISLLERWEGSWSYLPTLKWIRISRSGNIQPSSFPPKGQS